MKKPTRQEILMTLMLSLLMAAFYLLGCMHTEDEWANNYCKRDIETALSVAKAKWSHH